MRVWFFPVPLLSTFNLCNRTMKKLLLSLTILTGLTSAPLFAQQNVVIRGKITLLTPDKSIQLNNETVLLKPDGSFEYKTEVNTASLTGIRTDSAYARLWLTQGDYFLNLQEESIPGTKYHRLILKMLNGPDDAKIYSDFNAQTETGFSGMMTPALSGGKGQRTVATRYLDSLITHFPNAKSLPVIMRSAHHFVADSTLKVYITRLSPELQKSGDIAFLETELNRAEKLKPGVLFDDFELPTSKGGLLKLSSLKNKKLIVLDFWASDCAPCRAKHPDLVNYYKKYADKGLEIVSISLDSKRDIWLKAIEQDGIGDWLNVSDLKNWESDLVKNNFLNYIPFQVILSGDGKIIRTSEGVTLVNEKDLEKYLN